MESQLIRRAISGDAEALTALINHHQELAFNVALRITKNRQDAEDITQDCFLKVLEKLPRFREEAKFSTWLFRIVYNESLQLMRQRTKSLAFLDDPSLLATEAEGQTEAASRYADLHRAIDQLSVKERTLIDLFYLGGKSVKEIHQITGMSAANVKVILHRTRTKLHNDLTHG